MEFVYYRYVHALRIQSKVVIESLREKMLRLALFIYSFSKKKSNTLGACKSELGKEGGERKRGKGSLLLAPFPQLGF